MEGLEDVPRRPRGEGGEEPTLRWTKGQHRWRGWHSCWTRGSGGGEPGYCEEMVQTRLGRRLHRGPELLVLGHAEPWTGFH